jgi:hypothetical protein
MKKEECRMKYSKICLAGAFEPYDASCLKFPVRPKK